MKRRAAVSAIAAALSYPCWARVLQAAPVPESGSFRMSMQPWIGYALWYVARDRGFFEKNGLKKVEFVNYDEDAANLSIVASGAVDGTSTAVPGVLQNLQHDPQLRVVMLEDTSTLGDCIIAPKNISAVADLRGKAVAFEMGSTSHLLIADALSKAGLTLKAIKSVNVPAAQAAAALLAGRVDAAVTYEPYVSAALHARSDLARLYTAAQSPGLITDCFLVTPKALASRPGQIVAMIKSWGDAEAEYRRDTAACQRIMAMGIGADPGNLAATFAGVHLYGLAESRALLRGEFATSVLPRLNTLCTELGMIGKPVATDHVVDMAPLDAA
jgi:NitT/TauT family transport system substrate-binding protein